MFNKSCYLLGNHLLSLEKIKKWNKNRRARVFLAGSKNGKVAQLVEHLVEDQSVLGSNPNLSTNLKEGVSMTTKERFDKYVEEHCKNCENKNKFVCDIRITEIDDIIETKCNYYKREQIE